MKILLVEHLQLDASFSSRYLHQFFPLCRIGYSHNGADALEKVMHTNFDLIILGFPLKDMNHNDFLPLLKRRNGTARVMALFRWEDHSILQEVLEMGVCDFLFKPLQEVEFQARLHLLFSEKAEAAAGSIVQQEKEYLKTALRESEARYKMLFESANDAILIIKEGCFIECNEKALELYGASREEITGQTPHFFSPPLQPDGNSSRVKALERIELAKHNKPQLFEWRHRKLDGTPLDVEVSLNRIFYEGETLIQAIVRDITRHKQVETVLQHRIKFENLITSLSANFINHPTTKINDAIHSALQQIGEFAGVDRSYVFMLSDSEERYRDILATIEEGYYETDLTGRITFCNDAACRLIGYSRMELARMRYDQLYKNSDIVYHTFNKVFSSGQPDRGFTLEMIRKDGTTVYGELSISLIRDKNGTVTGFRGLARDITERKKFEEQLKYLSMHDQLTGVYNRTYFEEEMQRLEGGRDYPITIISADVDGLKLVNDSMGHKQGDQMLVQCVQVLKQFFRSSDVLARVGGDEFAVILPRTGSDLAELIYKRIHKGFEEYNKSHPPQPLSLSLGFSTSPGPQRTLDVTYKEADSNMYREKLQHSSKARTQAIDSLLAALYERDYIAEGHAVRLQQLGFQMGKKIGLSAIELSDLALLARVHDLGKVSIPDRILFKNGPLSEKERMIMQQHSEKGFRIARASPDFSPIADLILRHHEYWDGNGYPLGLKGKEIPVECRILAIIDAYDAMVHDRPYRKAFKKQDALAELQRCAGTQFDLELVRIFWEIVFNG